MNNNSGAIIKIEKDVAIYPGTFDPITHGHIDIIKRGLSLFSRIIIAVGNNPSKSCLFSVDERIELIKDCTRGLPVAVEYFDGLLVEFAQKNVCNVIIRSLREVSDFDYEFQMAVMNRELDSRIETVFLMTDKEYFFLHSGLAKEMAQKKARLSSLVPANVEKKLREKFP